MQSEGQPEQSRKRVRLPPAHAPAVQEAEDVPEPPLQRRMEVLAFNPAGKGVDASKRLTLVLSVPAEGDECGIMMEPIAEYRLEWLPPAVPQCVAEEAPELTKATIAECGHGFSALALVYHFLKNEMTCPLCRRGHAGARMSWHLLPPHLRLAMRERLDRMRGEERRALTEEDAAEVQRLMLLDIQALLGGGSGVALGRDEVTPASAVSSVLLNRQVLIVYAYVGEDSVAPLMVQEVALDTSISSDGTLRLSSYLHSMRELARNLRLLPARTTRFELAVASRRRGGGVLVLYRSRRFGPGTSEVPVAWGIERPAQMELEWVDAGLARFSLTVPGGGDLAVLRAPPALPNEWEMTVIHLVQPIIH